MPGSKFDWSRKRKSSWWHKKGKISTLFVLSNGVFPQIYFFCTETRASIDPPSIPHEPKLLWFFGQMCFNFFYGFIHGKYDGHIYYVSASLTISGKFGQSVLCIHQMWALRALEKVARTWRTGFFLDHLSFLLDFLTIRKILFCFVGISPLKILTLKIFRSI